MEFTGILHYFDSNILFKGLVILIILVILIVEIIKYKKSKSN